MSKVKPSHIFHMKLGFSYHSKVNSPLAMKRFTVFGGAEAQSRYVRAEVGGSVESWQHNVPLPVYGIELVDNVLTILM